MVQAHSFEHGTSESVSKNQSTKSWRELPKFPHPRKSVIRPMQPSHDLKLRKMLDIIPVYARHNLNMSFPNSWATLDPERGRESTSAKSLLDIC